MPYVPKPKATKERRVPVQARAIARVNKILDTASELLSDPAFSKITTHLIAEKAGVSVGSVYQFFPNVESVKIALIERLLDQYYEEFSAAISSNPDISDLSEFTEYLVNTTYEFYQKHPDVVAHIVSNSQSEEFQKVNASLNERVMQTIVSHFRGKNYGFNHEDLVRKVSVAIGIGDVMTMLIWSAESDQVRDAYLKDWKRISAFYSKLDSSK